MSITQRLNAIDAESAKDALRAIVEAYTRPAFGSLTKRDVDIMLFMQLQQLGVIDENPQLYDLVTQLRVTRSKARTLLYESNLRRSDIEQLDRDLQELLRRPILFPDGDKIGLELDSPLLIDHLRHRLRAEGHITDGSFSPELVKLTHDGFAAIMAYCIGKSGNADRVRSALINAGAIADPSLKNVLKGAIRSLATIAASEAGGQLAETIGDRYIGPLLDGATHIVQAAFRDVLRPAT